MAEFKKWMTEDTQDSPKIAKDQHVRTNLNFKHVVEKIDCIDVNDSTVLEVAKYFMRHGGTVKEVNQETATVKNKKGIFSMPLQDLFAE